MIDVEYGPFEKLCT